MGASFAYDLADRRTDATLANSVASAFEHDLANRLMSIQHAHDVTALFHVEYGYDAVGNRLFMRNLTPGLEDRSELYEYDQRHRLRRMGRREISGDPEPVLVSPIADNDLAAAQDWTILDRRGNWNEFAETIGVSPVTTTQTRTRNAVNEYQAIDPDGPGPQLPVNLAHDANGNVTLDPTARNLGDGEGGVPDPSGQAYEYDEENRLTAVRRAWDNALLLEIGYDAVGRRVSTADYLAAGDPCGGGFGGQAVPPGGSVYHYLHDVLGSVVALTSASGQVVERYTYDPYGKTVIEQTDPATGLPTARLEASAFGNPFSWTGQRYDAGVRLYHFLFRGYSPHLGRWMQRDPLEYVAGINLFEYALGTPLVLTDEEGLDPCAKLRSELQSLTARAANVAASIAAQRTAIQSLKQTIANIAKELAERESELHRNPLGLPALHPDDIKNPAKSRNGHRRIIADLRKALKANEAALKSQETLLRQKERELSELNTKIAQTAAALAACEKAEKKAKKSVGRIVGKVCLKGVKAGTGKVPVVGACFFVYDWYTGGFGHAVNELCWPVSEIWD